ncbi:hypothetical protein V5O48_002454, partial [Marasmius crinis-equi]
LTLFCTAYTLMLPHPRFLKKVVLPQMAERNEVERIRLSKRSIEGEKMNSIKVTKTDTKPARLLEPIPDILPPGTDEEWRWRLVEDHQFIDTPDPSPDSIHAAQSHSRRSGFLHVKSERQRKALYVPPHDHQFGLKE